MTPIKEDTTRNIIGGSNYVSGTVINALVNVIKLLMDAGQTVGSSIRRVVDHNVCPLK
ncbi:MAG: hypothetical protein HFJ12_03265 [Bacilli bacterium]|nr:hypothetical protein [Bacilli bacterium]